MSVAPLSGRVRWALGLAYAGSAYQGWQSQPGGLGIQDVLEAALAQFVGEPLRTLCAGRTDARVHALMQVVHFDVACEREAFSWVRGVNRYLPPDVAVHWARTVPETFHARASAISRRYAYVLWESPVRPSIDHGRVGWVFRALDASAMEAAARFLIGVHDFSSFRAAQCQAVSPVKHLMRLDIRREGAYWRFDFEANAFLHHMIRNIMGCLIAIGQGLHGPDWMDEVLQARSRAVAAPTFSPHGLYFLGPVYDPAFGLPERTGAFDWLP